MPKNAGKIKKMTKPKKSNSHEKMSMIKEIVWTGKTTMGDLWILFVIGIMLGFALNSSPIITVEHRNQSCNSEYDSWTHSEKPSSNFSYDYKTIEKTNTSKKSESLINDDLYCYIIPPKITCSKIILKNGTEILTEICHNTLVLHYNCINKSEILKVVEVYY